MSIEGLPAGLTSNAVVAGPSDDRVTLSLAALVDATQGPSSVVVTARGAASKIHKEVPLDVFVRGRAGELDTTFAKGGYAETHIAGVHSNLFDMTVLTDDAIVGAGSIGVGAITENNYNGFALAKYDANGQPAQSFGTSGTFHAPIVAGEAAFAVLDQTAKGVVLGGNGPRGFVLRRYSPAGPVDQGFGVGGEVLWPASDRYFISVKLLAQSGGKIVAVGTSINAGRREPTAIRYTADGQLDSTFGTGGYAFTPSTECADARDALVLADDRIVIGGESYPCSSPSTGSGLVVRLTAAGQPDSTFGTAGKAIVKHSPVQSALALSGDRLLLLQSWGFGSAELTLVASNGTEESFEHSTDGSSCAEWEPPVAPARWKDRRFRDFFYSGWARASPRRPFLRRQLRLCRVHAHLLEWTAASHTGRPSVRRSFGLGRDQVRGIAPAFLGRADLDVIC